MKNPRNETETTTYSCGGVSVTGDCGQLPKKECAKDLGFCLKKTTGSSSRPNSSFASRLPVIPTKEQKIEKMIVNMGSDGTRDDVRVKICSQDRSACCDSGELSHLLSREWVENKQETWNAGDLGKCKKQIFKVIF